MEVDKNSTPNLQPNGISPKWNWTTKLIVGLVLATIGLFFLVRFHTFLGPLLMSFIIAYLFYPISNFVRKITHLKWRSAVAIVYILVALILIGLLTWGGVALIEQIQNLISFIQNNIDQLPDLIQEWTSLTISIGPFTIDLPNLNWGDLTREIINTVQPILGQAGSLVGKLVSGGASFIFWTVIVLVISFFILSETEGVPDSLIGFKIPGYSEDMQRLGKELSIIWNGFIRGEMIVIATAIAIFTVLLGSLGLQFFFGLALIAGLGRLVPYLGAWISWIAFGLVALLQSNTPFGMVSGWFVVLVLVPALVIDSILDHILTPKVMSSALRVHPAAILVAALIGASLLGVVGIILAAPVFASLQLIVRYLFSKMADTDPWEILDHREPPKLPRWMVLTSKIWKKVKQWFITHFKPKLTVEQWAKKIKAKYKHKE